MARFRKNLIAVLPVLPGVGIYLYIAGILDFIQDDAYITFRYVANYLNGHGLVFNIGERIEGFTNFGWTIYLLLSGALGFDYVSFAQTSGLVFGALSIFLIYKISDLIFEGRHFWFALLPAYVVSINFAFAYWAPAGLETAAFTFLALLSFYLYLNRSWALAAALALAVWVRPEGALVAIILIIIESVVTRKMPRFAVISSAIAFVVSLPFLAFKIFYYGSILPNPFYAKTGFDFEQLISGLEYAGQFFLHYGFLGLGFILALLFHRQLSRNITAVIWFCAVYIVYIVLVGGDVLKIHRFFLPVFGPSAILISFGLMLLFKRFIPKTRNLLLFLISLLLFWLTYKIPLEEIEYYNMAEKTFVSKMDFLANEIKRTDSTDFSLAISTIGKFGYVLLGHDVIDILGLTDSTIARHSQTDIAGLETTWKERKYNVRYILERAPDYVVFSTGSKPSAPAEKALFLYPSFFNSYVPLPWSRKTDPSQISGRPHIAFKKVRPVVPDLDNRYPLQYVEYFKLGLELYPTFDFERSLAYFDSAMDISPKPVNPYVLYEKAFTLGKMSDFESSWTLMDEIISRDSFFVMAHRDAYLYSRFYDDTADAKIHEEWVRKMTPWYWDEVKAIVDEQVAEKNRNNPGK